MSPWATLCPGNLRGRRRAAAPSPFARASRPRRRARPRALPHAAARARAGRFRARLASPPAAARARPPREPSPPPAAASRRRRTSRDAAPRPRAEREELRPFFEEHLPGPLLRRGPGGLLWWQWLAVPALVALALAAGAALGYATRRALGHLASRTENRWDDLLVERLRRPLTAFWALGVFALLLPWLGLGEAGAGVLHHLLRAAIYLVLFWAGFRLADVAFATTSDGPWARASPGVVGFLPLGRKVGKVLLLALGLVAVLDALGFQVASLLAGLGIGGIALALAAQKTVENLFGSVSIGMDQPFRVGRPRAGGGRARHRRGDRDALHADPNARPDPRHDPERQARRPAGRDVRGARPDPAPREPRPRLRDHGGADARGARRDRGGAAGRQPKLWTESLSVRFTEFRDSTLNVEVMAWFTTSDWNEFTAIRQDVFLEFMAVVERAGTTFAYPTRTVHVVQRPGA